MLIFETGDNSGNELVIKGENRPLSFHYDNEFIELTIKNSKSKSTVNLNFDDLTQLVEELTNYLVIIDTKMHASKSKK